jgi:hypothetical protein
MAKQQNFHASPKVDAWLETVAPRKKTQRINALLERGIDAEAEAVTNFDLLREAVLALHNLHTVFLELVSEVARMGERQ